MSVKRRVSVKEHPGSKKKVKDWCQQAPTINRNIMWELSALAVIIPLLSSPLETTTQRSHSIYMLLSMAWGLSSDPQCPNHTQSNHSPTWCFVDDEPEEKQQTHGGSGASTEAGGTWSRSSSKHFTYRGLSNVCFLYGAVNAHVLIMRDPGVLTSVTGTPGHMSDSKH